MNKMSNTQIELIDEWIKEYESSLLSCVRSKESYRQRGWLDLSHHTGQHYRDTYAHYIKEWRKKIFIAKQIKKELNHG